MEELKNKKWHLEDIESVEPIDSQEQYVYDIEVAGNHNFFANDILVHNSLYIEFGRLINALHIPIKGSNGEDIATRFVVDLWRKGVEPYINKCYDEYAKKFNCDKNLEVLELEKVYKTIIALAKKKYLGDICFEEPDIFLNDLEHQVYKGIEVIQSSTPKFAREKQKEFYVWIFEQFLEKSIPPSYPKIIEYIKKIKQEFMVQNPDDICKSAGMSDYDKFVLDDKNSLMLGSHIPIHVKAAAIYNYFLYQDKHKNLRTKYAFLKSKDKVKYYYTTSPTYPVFGYEPGKFPIEMALPMDYDKTFEKTILDPLNRVLVALGFKELNSNLCYSSSLW